MDRGASEGEQHGEGFKAHDTQHWRAQRGIADHRRIRPERRDHQLLHGARRRAVRPVHWSRRHCRSCRNSLAALREAYGGKLGILAGFARRIDLAVLADGPADPESEPRDRLFEIMMRRFDALALYKPAVDRMAHSARCDPGLAAVLHRLAVRSQKWTLVAAGIRLGGLRGRVAVEGAVLAYAEAMRAWLDDDDPDLARTMAALDRALRRGERGMQMLSDLCSLVPRFDRRGRRRRPATDEAAMG